MLGCPYTRSSSRYCVTCSMTIIGLHRADPKFTGAPELLTSDIVCRHRTDSEQRLPCSCIVVNGWGEVAKLPRRRGFNCEFHVDLSLRNPCSPTSLRSS
jgi:ferredoxin